METKKMIACVIIVFGFIFLYVGYQKSQPTMMESFAGGMAEFAASLDSSVKNDVEQGMSEVNNERYKRGLPFYILGVVGIIGGFFVFAGGTKNQGDIK